MSDLIGYRSPLRIKAGVNPNTAGPNGIELSPAPGATSAEAIDNDGLLWLYDVNRTVGNRWYKSTGKQRIEIPNTAFADKTKPTIAEVRTWADTNLTVAQRNNCEIFMLEQEATLSQIDSADRGGLNLVFAGGDLTSLVFSVNGVDIAPIDYYDVSLDYNSRDLFDPVDFVNKINAELVNQSLDPFTLDTDFFITGKFVGAFAFEYFASVGRPNIVIDFDISSNASVVDKNVNPSEWKTRDVVTQTGGSVTDPDYVWELTDDVINVVKYRLQVGNIYYIDSTITFEQSLTARSGDPLRPFKEVRDVVASYDIQDGDRFHFRSGDHRIILDSPLDKKVSITSDVGAKILTDSNIITNIDSSKYVFEFNQVAFPTGTKLLEGSVVDFVDVRVKEILPESATAGISVDSNVRVANAKVGVVDNATYPFIFTSQASGLTPIDEPLERQTIDVIDWANTLQSGNLAIHKGGNAIISRDYGIIKIKSPNIADVFPAWGSQAGIDGLAVDFSISVLSVEKEGNTTDWKEAGDPIVANLSNKIVGGFARKNNNVENFNIGVYKAIDVNNLVRRNCGTVNFNVKQGLQTNFPMFSILGNSGNGVGADPALFRMNLDCGVMKLDNAPLLHFDNRFYGSINGTYFIKGYYDLTGDTPLIFLKNAVADLTIVIDAVIKSDTTTTPLVVSEAGSPITVIMKNVTTNVTAVDPNVTYIGTPDVVTL